MGEQTDAELAATAPRGSGAEAQLIAMVLDGVTSQHSRRAYRTGLEQFFAWGNGLDSGPRFSKALVQRYRRALLDQGLSAATINLRLSPIRKLAREMVDNGMLDATVAAAIERTPGVAQRGARIGNWLLQDQANALLNAPSEETLSGKRDRAILGLLLGCGLRRGELIRLNVGDIQQREGRWVIPDMIGKGNRRRTVTVPAGAKARIDVWVVAANIQEGALFRPIGKNQRLSGTAIKNEKQIWRVVERHAMRSSLGKLAPHDLRRTCAKLCRKAGGDLEQIQLLLGHASVQTTERYLGTEQRLSSAVNDLIGLTWR